MPEKLRHASPPMHDTTSYLVPQQISILIEIKDIDKPKIKPGLGSTTGNYGKCIKSAGC